jgi:translocation and assembly module TamA
VDDVLAPQEGWALRVNAGYAPTAVSSESFGRLVARGSYYWPLTERDDLYFRSDLGWVIADSGANVPQFFLFRTGGDTTIRGYEFQSIGVDEGRAVLGGRYLGVASVEYTRWMDESWGIATFIDTGDATDAIEDFGLVTGYGMGARVRSPVGPFRLDLAYGRDTDSFRLHFSFGLRF